MSFLQRLILSIRSRCGNATKLQRMSVIGGTLLLLLLLLSSNKKNNNEQTTGDANLTYLKTNPKLTQQLVQLAASTAKQPSYSSVARKESGGFLEMDDTQFQMLKHKAHAMQPNTRGSPFLVDGYHERPEVWFQNHYEPEFTCALERRIGRLGDGGKWVCNPHVISAQPKCLVYSVGSNGDASLEAAILQDISKDCEIHVFDFGNYKQSVLHQTKNSPHVYYHEWGISDVTSGVFKTLKDTVTELGHAGRTIDIFKIDCEGCELDTVSSWFDTDIVLKQILVEIHSDMARWQPRIKLPQTVNLFQTLHNKGYVITHKEPNIQYQGNGICVEYNFLLLSPEFWSNKDS